MAERDLRGTWKGREKKVKKTFSPLIGMVYKAEHSGVPVFGVLVELNEESAVLQTKENKLVCVDKKSLKIVASY
jgi:hypothetical protein